MSLTFKQRAQQIQNETTAGANTASRVGGLLSDTVDQFDTAYINCFDFSSGAVTTIATAGTWVKLNTTTTQGFSRGVLTHSNNRITWTGTTTRVFELSGIASLNSGNNNIIHTAFFKNEELHPCSEQDITTSGAGKSGIIAFQCLISLAQNDFVEVYVKNENATTSITLNHLNVIVKQL